MSLIERCARALYGMAGEKWLENYPWESAETPAVEARGMAMEQARVALEAVNHQGAVEALRDARQALAQVADTPGSTRRRRLARAASDDVSAALDRFGGQ